MRAYGIQDCSCERQLCVRVFSGAAARGAVIFSKITAARGAAQSFVLSGTAARGAVIFSKITAARGSCAFLCFLVQLREAAAQ
jgi:hypothetical protein